MATTTIRTCPFGVLNLHAAAEAASILQSSSKPAYQELSAWISKNYLNNQLVSPHAYTAEPLGCRIRSVVDLKRLVHAYSNARAMKKRATKTGMENELYFYGQVPGREAAEEAGRMEVNPDSPVEVLFTLKT